MNLQNLRRTATAAGFALVTSSALFAQSQTGNVFGDVKDDKAQPLPGVTLTLTTGAAPQIQVTDAQGNFRFVGVYPGTYRLEGSLEGFSPVVYEAVNVNVNRNTTLSLTMNAAVAETITITAESPLLDTRKIQTGATIDYTELQKVPTARDPWVILATTPGVLVDRVNVGGNESGQQSGYAGNGDDGRNSSWAVDGVEITDVGAIGSSSSYYDFDAFEELQITTGGSDAGVRTGGVGLNLVTKRGTNEWRASGRYIKSDQDWQSSFDPNTGDFGAAGPWNDSVKTSLPVGSAQATFKSGNRIVQVEDYGAELGGPILKDRLWIWGSYGKNDIQLLTVTDFSDDTQLETQNAKLNWQVAQNNSATVFYSSNDKEKQGRNASPFRPQPTTWNQTGLASEPNLFSLFSERPTIMKIEDTHIFGSNFFLTGSYAESDGGFHLAPQGGTSRTQPNATLDLVTSVWAKTFLDYGAYRPQDQYKADGSYFFATGSLNHELKFGANYRKAEVRSLTIWPGFGIDYTVPVGGAPYYLYTSVIADGVLNYEVEYKNAYVQDTLTSGNLTANVGLRYDVQGGTQLAGFVPPVAGFEAFMPGYSFGGADPGFDDWKDISPRLGLTYALGEEKKTLLRASYSRFVDQIGGFGVVSQTYPIYPAPYFGSYAYDTNGNGHIDPSELVGPHYAGPNYNPDDPSFVIQSNGIDRNLSAPTTDEITVGVEHALAPEFVVGLTATFREINDLLEYEQLVFDNSDPRANLASIGRKATAADFVVTRTHTVVFPDGSTRNVDIYSLKPGVSTRGGTFLENGDAGQTYKGVSATFNKRLSNNWMWRGNVSWNDWKWDIPSSDIENPQQPFGGGNKDGDRVLVCSGTGSGAKGNVCISSQWSYAMSGMYQVMPDRAWGFNVAASLNGREGYALPYTIRGRRTGFRSSAIQTMATARPDDYKLDDVHVLDLRVEKEFKFDRVGLTIGVDCFNALNESTVLQRQLRLDYPTRTDSRDGASTGDHVTEVLSPQIFRIGARISFN